jgi:hypothetical protein
VPTLLDAPPIDLAVARARLRELRRRAAMRLAAAILLVLCGTALMLDGHWRPAGVALLVGAAASLATAAASRSDRRRTLVALVAQGAELPAVRRTASALSSPRERLRLARSLRVAAEHGDGTPVNAPLMVDPARAADAAARLRQLADAIAALRVPTEPSALALCRQMLTEPRRSPLCNSRLPAAELERLLRRLERGIVGAPLSGPVAR